MTNNITLGILSLVIVSISVNSIPIAFSQTPSPQNANTTSDFIEEMLAHPPGSIMGPGEPNKYVVYLLVCKAPPWPANATAEEMCDPPTPIH